MKVLSKVVVGVLIIIIAIFGYQKLFSQNISKTSSIVEKRNSSPGSDVAVSQTLPDGDNYKRYIVSFMRDGSKEYAYLTVPIFRQITQWTI